MTDLIGIKDCDSVEEFWSFISPLGRNFWSDSQLFRGQRDSDWKLVPAVFRQDVLTRFDRAGFRVSNVDDHALLQFECDLIKDFIDACDARGLLVPGDNYDMRRALEEIAYTGATQRLTKWPGPSLYPVVALAQHHGIPTRLLDVTTQPYVAAYFAASSAIEHALSLTEPSQARAILREKRLSVHAMDYGFLHVAAGIRRVKVPGSTSLNVSAQSGAFIILDKLVGEGSDFRDSKSVEAKLSNISDLSNTTGSPVSRHQLWKVTLPVERAAELLDCCARHGIHRATMFPGYDGAAERVKETFRTIKFHELIEMHAATEA